MKRKTAIDSKRKSQKVLIIRSTSRLAQLRERAEKLLKADWR